MPDGPRPRVTVVGLGPGGRDQLTGATLDAIAAHPAEARFVRTRRHPTADIGEATSFDDVYDRSEHLPDVYRTITDRIVAAASTHGAVLYAVPGSPLVLERSVARLRDEAALDVTLVPAVSFLDAAWAALGIDPVEAGVRLVDGHVFATAAAGQTGPLLVAHTHAPWVLSDIKLAVDLDDDPTVVVLQRLGTSDESIHEVRWSELDRAVEPDHLTSLYVPELGAPVAAELQRTVELMDRLRVSCPWDAEQTHASLRPYLVEEAYEVLEAVDEVVAEDPDGYAHLEEELGDLWFQVLFHSKLAAEAGQFTVADVARTVHDKLVGRHPHVFGDVDVADADAVAANWESIKQQEKGRASVMDGIPRALPALLRAAKVAKKGGALVEGGALTADEAGRRLLELVVETRSAGIDPEETLRLATDRAIERFDRGEAAWLLG